MDADEKEEERKSSTQRKPKKNVKDTKDLDLEREKQEENNSFADPAPLPDPNLKTAEKQDYAKEVEEPRVTGEDVGKAVLSTLKKKSIDVFRCVGVGTDGCNMMVSEVCGAVAEVQKQAKHAVRCPCFNHVLNLSISKSSDVQHVRNAMGVMTLTISFFTASSKRSYVLQVIVGRHLSGLCETRWIERHDGVIQFRTLLPKIVEAVKSIAAWKDAESASRAKTILSALCEDDFIVTVIFLSEILADTKPLSMHALPKNSNRLMGDHTAYSDLKCPFKK